MLFANLKDTVGTFCAVLQYAIILIGLTHQILLIRENKSSKSVSVPFFGLTLTASISWLAYGYLAGDRYIMLPQFLAIAGGIVLFYFIFRYRHNGKRLP